MKTEKEIEDILKSISDICKKHGVVLFGCCDSAGIYSEIVISDAPSKFCVANRSTIPWKDDLGNYQIEAIGINKES